MNAVAGVEGAFTLITQETLCASDRTTLTQMLVSGLSRLRGLASSGPEDDLTLLADVTASLAAEPAWHDRVLVDVATDMVVAGSPDEIMEAVRRLVAHSIDRSPTGWVRVCARRSSDGDRIELWVDNERVLSRADDHCQTGGWVRRPWPAPDTTMELEVAIRLAEGQRGEVRVKSEPGGGESLLFSWPVPVD